MRIAIVGAGGVGGLLAGLLSRAGEEVVLVARGAAAEAARRDGLTVHSGGASFTARPALVAEDPAAAGPCEATLVAVKAWQVAPLAGSLAPLLAGGGLVAPLQNGVEAAGRLAAGLPAAQVAGGLCFMFAWAEAPAVVRHAGAPPRVILGSRPGAPLDAALGSLAAALTAAGAPSQVVPDVAAASWEKLLFVEPMGTAGALSRAPAGPLRGQAEPRALVAGLMAEVAAVAAASGSPLGEGVVARTLAKLDAVPADATVSMHRDLAAGRPSELHDQAGAVVRLGRAAGVAVPLHEACWAALLPLERAARGEAPPFERT